MDVQTDIPARLDRLPWSSWHWRIVAGLGITWILDGLEVTIIGAVAARLTEAGTLHLQPQQIGLAGSLYLIGAVIGALGFGYATDRLGRKRLFMITLGWYVVATVATAFSWDAVSFLAFRFLTGMGIGGEYSAINSSIDELIPARFRGAADIAINGTWWLGTALGSLESLLILNPHVVDQRFGWRIAFGGGAVLGIVILFLRHSVPESPRWLFMHGRRDEAQTIVAQIEKDVGAEKKIPDTPLALLTIDGEHRASYGDIMYAIFVTYRRRMALALTLMITQAFLYNAIFFTYALILSTFFAVPAERVGLYILPFAFGNVLGPLLLGGSFDRFGRRKMITATYGISGILLLATAAAFGAGMLDATTITLAWCVIFFFASAGASAAYLTASEIFPVEARATAIAVVYAVGTLIGGAVAPWLFGVLIATKSVGNVVIGYVLGAVCMLAGAAVEAAIGLDAEGKSLEDISAPLARRGS